MRVKTVYTRAYRKQSLGSLTKFDDSLQSNISTSTYTPATEHHTK